jgi:hypothetical protein
MNEDMPIELAAEDVALSSEVLMDSTVQAQESERRKRKWDEYVASAQYQDKLKKRIAVNDACYRYPEARKRIYASLSKQATLDEMVESCVTFIEMFGFTFDPRPQASPNHLPFFLFDYQKETIEWLIKRIEGGEDGLIEKSRDMGVSWVVFVYVPLWYWLFRDGTNILLGSYKEDLVDNRTKDSLFGMIDYAMLSMPKWLLPRGYNKDKNRNHLKLVNPMNWNQITGDTMNPDFGRGSRKTVILFDELGSWDYAKDAWESAGDSTTCRIGNSTPKGYNFFAMLRETAMAILTLHWTKHPLKDQKWYEFEKARRSPEEVAQELDISYNKSQVGRVYAEWSDPVIEMGNFPYEPNWPLYTFWDYGKTDDTAIIWVQKNQTNGKIRIVDTYCSANKNIDFFVPFCNGIIGENSHLYTSDDLKIIQDHKRYRRATHFGDPAGRFVNAVTNQTVFSVLRDNGIIVNFRDSWKYFTERKVAARSLIQRGIEVNSNARTKYFNICMANAAYPKMRGNGGVEEIRSVEPKHDYTSHYRSAFEYGALGLREVTRAYNTVYDKFSPGRRGSKAIGY